jgi:hypothetical protein
MNKFFSRGLVAAGVLLTATASQAAPIDVAAVATAISDTIVPIGTIGAGVLLIMVSLKTFKWVRASLG